MMSLESDRKTQPPRRKSLWPWLLLLILTLLTIYSWHRATELWDDFSRNMPTAIIDLFNDLLNEHRPDERAGPKLDVMVPVLFSVK